MGIVILFIVGSLAIGVAGWMWRINLAINHPEKNAALEKLEERLRKQRAETSRAGLKAAKVGIRVVRLMLKKR